MLEVNVTVAVVGLVKSMLTVPKGPVNPEMAEFPALREEVNISAFAC